MIYFGWFIIAFHHLKSNKNCVPIISIILYLPKIGDYLKILTDNEVKDIAVIHFGEYFKSTNEKLYSKLYES